VAVCLPLECRFQRPSDTWRIHTASIQPGGARHARCTQRSPNFFSSAGERASGIDWPIPPRFWVHRAGLEADCVAGVFFLTRREFV
jgi:hypothetical protein